MAVRTVTIQTFVARERPKWILSKAIKEIEHDRDSGQPDVPGLAQRQTDTGEFSAGCADFVCPEDIYPAIWESLASGKLATGDAVPDGANFKTPARSKRLDAVWFDGMRAEEGIHYTTSDQNVIVPIGSLEAGTLVKARFVAY